MKKIRAFSILFAAVIAVMLAAGSLPAADKININTASAKELTQLDRVGPAIADRIAEYREQNGPFEKIEDIMKVRGIGPKFFEGIKDRITVGDAEQKASEEAETSDENASQEDKAAETKDSGTDKSADENKPSGDKAAGTDKSADENKPSGDKKSPVLTVAAGTPALSAEEKININTASAEELTRLHGIGPVLGTRIAEFRKENGPFKHPEDITKVKGISPNMFEAFKDRITVGEPEEKAAPKTDEKGSQEDKAAGTKDSGTDKSADENKSSGDKKSEG